MNAWYCVYTAPRMELWARGNLWERGLEVYLPLVRCLRRHARRADWVEAALFPGYLFARADLAAGDRRRIASAPGVRNLVAFGPAPAQVPASVIAEIRAREDASGHIALDPMAGLKPGDAVRLQWSALDGCEGLFDGASDKQRVVVLLQLLGREVRVRAPAGSVARLG